MGKGGKWEYRCEWSAVQGKQRIAWGGDSCVLCLGPLGLAGEILLLGAEILLDAKAGKKREESAFIRWKETAEKVFCLFVFLNILIPDLLFKNSNITAEEPGSSLKTGWQQWGFLPSSQPGKQWNTALPLGPKHNLLILAFWRGRSRLLYQSACCLGFNRIHNPNCSIMKETMTGLWTESCSLGSTSAQT